LEAVEERQNAEGAFAIGGISGGDAVAVARFDDGDDVEGLGTAGVEEVEQIIGVMGLEDVFVGELEDIPDADADGHD
jgi:hypothetical protein